jgi:hypothetical protein
VSTSSEVDEVSQHSSATIQHHQPNKAFSEPATLFKAKTEREWLELLPKLLDTHGLDKLSTWRDAFHKHNNRLVHTAAERSYQLALKVMTKMGFDLNSHRDSDKCTLLHLVIWEKSHKRLRYSMRSAWSGR